MKQTVRIQLAQTEVYPGHPWKNTERMLEKVAAAKADHADIIVFPEMAVPGYLIGDAWEHEAFLRECEACTQELCQASHDIGIIFGNVGLDWDKKNEDGRVRKYNALFVAHNGQYLSPEEQPYDFIIKTLHPNYRQFDDSRHFFDLRKLAAELQRPMADLPQPIHLNGLRLGCVICEDTWDTDYPLSPMQMLQQKGVDLFVNISSSPFTFNKKNKRDRIFTRQAQNLRAPIIYVNNVGIQNNGKTVFTFDGHSGIYDTQGHYLSAGAPFEESTLTLEFTPDTPQTWGGPAGEQEDSIAELHQAIVYGTQSYMDLCKLDKVAVGISGGIDSAVVAAIYAQILPPGDLLLVNMPGEHTSTTTRDLARDLAENLGCYYADVPIVDSVRLTNAQLNGLVIKKPGRADQQTLHLTDFMLENVQARDRSSRILSAAATAFGGIFTCNANKSEATVGYTTIYGDLCGYLANIADLWKHEVYDLARYINRSVFPEPVIPEGCLTIPPSAELSPAHNVDEGKGDPLCYPYHDALFRSWVESWNRTTPEEILRWYGEGTLEDRIGYVGRIKDIFPDHAAFITDLERWWNQYQGMGLVKRIQAPPVLAVKRRAFGFDHREALMGPYYTRAYQQQKERLLNGNA